MTHAYPREKPIAGNESVIADRLVSDDNELLACTVFAEKKYASILEAILSKKSISKVSVAAYLNPFIHADIKREWLKAIQSKDYKLAQTVSLFLSKMPKLMSSSATEDDFEKFHIAASSIMQYLTKESASLVKNAIATPGWVGILRIAREKDSERSPWSLKSWISEKGYKA